MCEQRTVCGAFGGEGIILSSFWECYLRRNLIKKSYCLNLCTVVCDCINTLASDKLDNICVACCVTMKFLSFKVPVLSIKL